MGATPSYNDAAFRQLFPAFCNTNTYPQASMQVFWGSAGLYINNQQGGCFAGGLSAAQQLQAQNLMTAHLAFINNLILTGQVPGIVTGATIDKISVTLEPPPAKNQWQYWLNTSPYGMQLLALLQLVGVGGMYITSGLPARAGFRGGVW